MNIDKLRKFALETSSLYLPSADPVSIRVAIEINRILDPVLMPSTRRAAHYDREIYPIVCAKLEEICKKLTVDKLSAKRITREMYLERQQIMFNPIAVVFEILQPGAYRDRYMQDDGYMFEDEHVLSTAYWACIEIMNANRAEIQGALKGLITNGFNGMGSIRNQVTDKAYDVFLRDVGSRATDDIMRRYHKVVTDMVRDTFEAVRAIVDMKRIDSPSMHLVLEYLVGDVTRHSIPEQQERLLINAFYEKEVLSPPEASKSAEDEKTPEFLAYPDDAEETIDMESLENAVGELDIESLESFVDEFYAYASADVPRIEYYMSNGMTRYTAAEYMGLDIIKDADKLAHLSKEASLENTVVAMKSKFGEKLKNVAKLSKQAVVALFRFIEKLVRALLGTLAAPFGAEAKFLSRKSERVPETWMQKFKSPIEIFIENNVLAGKLDIIAAPDVASHTAGQVSMLLEKLRVAFEQAKKLDEQRATPEKYEDLAEEISDLLNIYHEQMISIISSSQLGALLISDKDKTAIENKEIHTFGINKLERGFKQHHLQVSLLVSSMNSNFGSGRTGAQTGNKRLNELNYGHLQDLAKKLPSEETMEHKINDLSDNLKALEKEAAKTGSMAKELNFNDFDLNRFEESMSVDKATAPRLRLSNAISDAERLLRLAVSSVARLGNISTQISKDSEVMRITLTENNVK
jgi:hypothetical protein